MRLAVPCAARATSAALRRDAATQPTYDGPSVLGLGSAPPGYALVTADVVVGNGGDDFSRAADGLRTWAAHRIAGVRVAPSEPVALGGTYLVTMGSPLLAVAAPCRVTRVTEGDGRFGFSYRTLPGHPERGEEAFDVRLDASGDVRFTIHALSAHDGAVMALAGPVAKLIQRRVTAGYGRALRRFVHDG